MRVEEQRRGATDDRASGRRLDDLWFGMRPQIHDHPHADRDVREAAGLQPLPESRVVVEGEHRQDVLDHAAVGLQVAIDHHRREDAGDSRRALQQPLRALGGRAAASRAAAAQLVAQRPETADTEVEIGGPEYDLLIVGERDVQLRPERAIEGLRDRAVEARGIHQSARGAKPEPPIDGWRKALGRAGIQRRNRIDGIARTQQGIWGLQDAGADPGHEIKPRHRIRRALQPAAQESRAERAVLTAAR